MRQPRRPSTQLSVPFLQLLIHRSQSLRPKMVLEGQYPDNTGHQSLEHTGPCTAAARYVATQRKYRILRTWQVWHYLRAPAADRIEPATQDGNQGVRAFRINEVNIPQLPVQSLGMGEATKTASMGARNTSKSLQSLPTMQYMFPTSRRASRAFGVHWCRSSLADDCRSGGI